MRCHSSLVHSKTGIPYQKPNLPLTASRPSRLGLSVFKTTCLIRLLSPLRFSPFKPYICLPSKLIFYCKHLSFLRLFLSAQGHKSQNWKPFLRPSKLVVLPLLIMGVLKCHSAKNCSNLIMTLKNSSCMLISVNSFALSLIYGYPTNACW